MNTFMITLLNLSLYGTYFICTMLLLRLLFLKLPKKFLYALWVLVFLKLCLPLSIRLPLKFHTIQPEIIPSNITYQTVPEIHSGIQSIDIAVNQILPPAAQVASINPMQLYVSLFSILWIIGVIVLIGYSFISWFVLKRKLNYAKHLEKNIFLSDKITSPFVLGISPKIYLPSGLSNLQKYYIVHHEEMHIVRKDHLCKPLFWFVLCIHWFNPFVWIAFHFMTKDMESACDEKVLDSLGHENKKAYCTTLLEFSFKHRLIQSSPVTFGENSAKPRIKSLLNYRKPTFWSILIGAFLITGMAIFFFTKDAISIQNPEDFTLHFENATSAEELYSFKTPYVGDNSKVGNILNRLFFPSEYKYNGFQILSEKEPYGLNIHFEVPLNLYDFHLGNPNESKNYSVLDNNSAILFALIDNLSYVQYELTYPLENKTATVICKREEENHYISAIYPHTVNEAGSSLQNFTVLYHTLGYPWSNELEKDLLSATAKQRDLLTDKYIPDTITEDLDMIAYTSNSDICNISVTTFYKHSPKIDNPSDEYFMENLRLSVTYQGDQLIEYYLKDYGYPFEKGRYFYTVTGGNINSLKGKTFPLWSKEASYSVKLNTDKAHSYQTEFDHALNPKDNLHLISPQKITVEEGKHLAEQFLHDFISSDLHAESIGADPKGYGEKYTDESGKYIFIINLDLGMITHFYTDTSKNRFN